MSFKPALGLSFVVWVLLSHFNTNKSKDAQYKESSTKIWTDLVVLAATPWLVLSSAWICLWMFFE
jgi:hypothetical protein